MDQGRELIPTEALENLIYQVRGRKVMLDSDLARVYGVPTKGLNRAVKRNADRFPTDFVFGLTANELESLRCQIGTGYEAADRNAGNERELDAWFRCRSSKNACAPADGLAELARDRNRARFLG